MTCPASRAGDAGGGLLALLDVPHGQHHRRAARGQDLGGLEPEAGIGAGDHGEPALPLARTSWSSAWT
jgi:hypothetical protein